MARKRGKAAPGDYYICGGAHYQILAIGSREIVYVILTGPCTDRLVRVPVGMARCEVALGECYVADARPAPPQPASAPVQKTPARKIYKKEKVYR